MLKFYKNILLLTQLTHVVLEINARNLQKLKTRVGIVHGTKAKKGEYTYQVSLQRYGKNICGGGIIDEEFLLSAAHCFIDDDGEFIQIPTTAVIGVNNIKPLISWVSRPIKIDVLKIYVPKGYTPEKEKNSSSYRPPDDICVLKLQEPIGFKRNPHIMKLNMPSNNDESYIDKSATITGFGWNIVKGMELDKVTKQLVEIGSSDGKLRYATAQVVPDEVCNDDIHDPISRKYLCGQILQTDLKKPKGACTGDSGSSLVLDGTTVIGILSTSPHKCNEIREGSVYARVSMYLDFIKDAKNNVVTRKMRYGVWLMMDTECKGLSPIFQQYRP